MLILGIETSNPASSADRPAAGVALVHTSNTDCEVLGVEWLRAEGRHDDDLMPAIDRLCVEAGIAPEELDCVGVSIGPGGYTGLRVACTTAMMISEACRATCVGVPTALALFESQSRHESAPAAGAAVILAVKGEQMYVHFAGQESGLVMPPEALMARQPTELIADRFLPKAVMDWAARMNVPIRQPIYHPVSVAVLAGKGTASDLVVPLYAREPEAVSRWREMGQR